MRYFMVCLVLLGGCDSRNVAVGDGGTDATADTRPDSVSCPLPVGYCKQTDPINHEKVCGSGLKCLGDTCLKLECSTSCYGKCVPKAACSSNEYHCEWEKEYCNLDSLCHSDERLQGSCQAIPETCTERADPVCGCDGKTYSSPCEAHRASVSVGKKGPCDELDCETLATLYRAAVQVAKLCQGDSDFVRCGSRVKSEVGCPCETFVDDSFGAREALDRLENLFTSKQCAPTCDNCPAIGDSGKCNAHQLVATCE